MILLLACAPSPPAPDRPAGVAGCSALEERLDAAGRPLLRGDRHWDHDGHPLAADTTLFDGVERLSVSERYTRSGGDLVREAVRSGPPGERGPWFVQTHTWSPDHLLLRTDLSHEVDGTSVSDGFRALRWDGEGHLAGWALDLGSDGRVDEAWDEVWTPGGFGWTVEVERSWSEEAPRWFQYREHDDRGLELFRTENWDVDEESEVVLFQQWDEEGHLSSSDLGGVGVFDRSCTFTWDGDDLVGQDCVEEGVARQTTFTYEAPGRRVAAEVLEERPGSGWEVVETWALDWTCPPEGFAR